MMAIVGLSKDDTSNADDVTDALLLMFFFLAATVQPHENALLDHRSKMMLYFLYSFCVLLLLSLQVRMIPSSTETMARGRTTASVGGACWKAFFFRLDLSDWRITARRERAMQLVRLLQPRR